MGARLWTAGKQFDRVDSSGPRCPVVGTDRTCGHCFQDPSEEERKPRASGRGGARRRWRVGAGVCRSETPSKHVRPARRGGRAGGPQHRGRGTLDELEQKPGCRHARGSVPAKPPAYSSPLCEEPPAVTGVGPGRFKAGLLTSEALPRHVRRGLLTRPLRSPPGSAPCSCTLHSEAAPGSQ